MQAKIRCGKHGSWLIVKYPEAKTGKGVFMDLTGMTHLISKHTP
jgi:hypothetical protein